jgi:GDP-L-fucose synthase
LTIYLTRPLEPTNRLYAIAKIMDIELRRAYSRLHGARFISVMPANLYGPEDNFDLESSHVLPASIRKFYEAKKAGSPRVPVWGAGKPRREFLHVDDLADACLFLMRSYEGSEIINVGVGQDISIAELAEMVRYVVGYDGRIVYDATQPDATPRKLLDTSCINGLGWFPRTWVRHGVEETYRWFVDCGSEERISRRGGADVGT